MYRFTVALATLLALVLFNHALANEPRVFTADGKRLAEVKARVAANDPAMAGPMETLRADADAALKDKNYSVTDKPLVPASGDKHDYLTLAPYWWPDPSKPDGLPYIRHDGKVNPERDKSDHGPFEQMSKNVNTLALAYYLTGDEQYATRAAEQLRIWFFDDATRMTPHLEYSQIVRGRESEVKPSGVLEGDRLRRVIDADGLLAGSKHWSTSDHERLVAWMTQYNKWMTESEKGKLEAVQPNNHGTWYMAQAATFALYLGDEAAAKTWVEKSKELIASAIEPDGSQPHELARTKSWDYCRYNILAFIQIANIGERVGVDLWNYQTSDGRSLRRAIDWMIPFTNGGKEWTYQQIDKPKTADMFIILRRAAHAYREPMYEDEAMKVTQAEPEKHRFNLVYPKPKFEK